MVWNRSYLNRYNRILSLVKFSIAERHVKLSFRYLNKKYKGKSLIFLKKRWKKFKYISIINYVKSNKHNVKNLSHIKTYLKINFFQHRLNYFMTNRESLEEVNVFINTFSNQRVYWKFYDSLIVPFVVKLNYRPSTLSTLLKIFVNKLWTQDEVKDLVNSNWNYLNLITYNNTLLIIKELKKIILYANLQKLICNIFMLIAPRLKRYNWKFKFGIFKFKKNKFIKNGVNKRQTTVKGRVNSRYRKKELVKKYFKYLDINNITTLTLIKNIYFSKKNLKFFSLESDFLGQSWLSSTSNNLGLFSYKLNFNNLYQKNYPFIKSSNFLIGLKGGQKISYLELFFKKGAQYIKSSGSKGTLITSTRFNDRMIVRLPSGEIKYFSMFSTCNLGNAYFKEKKLLTFNNVKLKRLRGRRSVVRGIAMNPVDHPHGGKKKSVRFPRNPWGKAAKLK